MTDAATHQVVTKLPNNGSRRLPLLLLHVDTIQTCIPFRLYRCYRFTYLFCDETSERCVILYLCNTVMIQSTTMLYHSCPWLRRFGLLRKTLHIFMFISNTSGTSSAQYINWVRIETKLRIDPFYRAKKISRNGSVFLRTRLNFPNLTCQFTVTPFI